MKNFNTFFDYWRGTTKSLMRSGKTLAGWTVTYGHNQIHGGITPTLTAIDTDNIDAIYKFRDALLGTDDSLSYHVKNILLANGLRFLNDFLLLLLKDPKKQYTSEDDVMSRHPFGAAIILACEKSGITFDTVKGNVITNIFKSLQMS